MKPTRAVLLHGFLGDRNDWSPVLPALERRLRCHLVELPGHGAQPAPIAQEDIIAWFAEWAPLVDASTVLIGYSMGGRVALHAVLRNGLRPRAVILEGASAGILDESERETRRERDCRLAERLRERGLSAFLREWYSQPLFASLMRNPGRLAEVVAGRTGDPLALAAALEWLSPGRMPGLGGELALLDFPVLALAGEEDPPYSAALKTLAAASPRILARGIAGAGHNVHRENPAGWLGAVEPFLETLA